MTDSLPFITGGDRTALSAQDRELIDHVVNRLLAVVDHLAHKGRQLELQCSADTYCAHLDFDELAAGPWLWDIKSGVPFGDIYLYSRIPGEPERKREGQFTVASIHLPN